MYQKSLLYALFFLGFWFFMLWLGFDYFGLKGNFIAIYSDLPVEKKNKLYIWLAASVLCLALALKFLMQHGRECNKRNKR